LKKKKHSRAKGIAETYIHIVDVPKNLTKEVAYIYLENNINKWAEETFKNKVNVKIAIEDGSLKLKVLIGGMAIVQFISNYGSFRSGINHIVDDAHKFSSMVIEHFKEDKNIPNEAIMRAERRLGVPGKIQRFYKLMDKINSDIYSHDKREELLGNLKEEFTSIIELLEVEDDRNSFRAEIPENIRVELPATLPEPIIGAITLENIESFTPSPLDMLATTYRMLPNLPQSGQRDIPLIANRHEEEEE
jgi:hypothetical protein